MSSPTKPLAGKVALITGAAAGQGAADAELFVRDGAAVMLTDIDAARGEALAKRLADQGGQAAFHTHDVAAEDGWQEVVAGTVAPNRLRAMSRESGSDSPEWG